MILTAAAEINVSHRIYMASDIALDVVGVKRRGFMLTFTLEGGYTLTAPANKRLYVSYTRSTGLRLRWAEVRNTLSWGAASDAARHADYQVPNPAGHGGLAAWYQAAIEAAERLRPSLVAA